MAFSVAWHDLRYEKRAMRRSRNARCFFGAKAWEFLHSQIEIASYQTYGFQASLRLEQQAQPHACCDKKGEEQPPKDIQSAEVKDNCYAHLPGEEER
jgi:hypothetical protein